MVPEALAERLQQLFRVLDREACHLDAVTARLFEGMSEVDGPWVEQRLNSPAGIDTLESFGAKFGRLQDALGDKLLPLFLRAAGETPGTAVENLNRAERLGLIPDAQFWLGARTLRNRLVHEYLDDPSKMAESLNLAKKIVPVLLGAENAFRVYVQERLGVEL